MVLLRVGIDTGSGGIHGPLFRDGTFEFICIPGSPRDKHTYGNTRGRHGRLLIDYFPESRQARMKDQTMHVDPEFETFTYGDPTGPKRGLRKLAPGDLLVFYSGLEGWDCSAAPALYITGYLEVQRAGLAPEFSDHELQALFAANAHVRHRRHFKDQRNRLVLVKGGRGSRLLRKAVGISEMAKNRVGQPLKVLSRPMRAIFGDFGGKVSIQRSPPRWVDDEHVEEAARFVRSLK